MVSVQLAENEVQVPFAKSFAGHETFAFRHAWLKKGVDSLSRDRESFQREDAIVTLGVGKNMVRSIRHWCLATRVAEEEPGTRARRLRPTDLGNRLLKDAGWDPYLEDEGTLWLLHWNLTSAGTRAATWYWTFNRFHEYAFTRPAMLDALTRFIQTIGWQDVSESTVKRDVDCLIHTYLSRRDDVTNGEDPIECPLTGLDLLVQEPDGDRLRLRTGPKPTLPSGVFTYALSEFWNMKCCERQTLELRQIIGSEGSPAQVFRLDEDSVLSYLDSVSDTSGGAMVFEDTTQVRRVVKRDEQPLASIAFLEAYYASR
ncbi:MAG: DUF4007 family protein [Armatimonadetes bacterium]|nr:DUF4007 family protein [Armatimonadota bacterium]